MHAAFARACALHDSLRRAAAGTLVVVCAFDDWSAWAEQAVALLSPEERARAARLHRASDRDKRHLAYALHRLFLAELSGIDPADVPLERDEHGCPRVQGWVATSLSHGEGAVALAVSRAGPVGVDIEAVARAATAAEVRASILHAGDASSVQNDDLLALLALWTRKEAVLKAAGVGLALAMTGFAAPAGVAIPLPAHGGRSIRAVSFFNAGQVVSVACDPASTPLLLELRPTRVDSGIWVD